MSESGHIRINELARELEVKAKVILEYLPKIGVTENKTHSSSISAEIADKVRQHFRQLAEAEPVEVQAAETQAPVRKAPEEAAANAARVPPAPPAEPTVVTPPRPPAPTPAVRPTPAAAPTAPTAPQAARPAATSVPAPKPATPAPAAQPQRPAPPTGKTLRTAPRPVGAGPVSTPQVQRPPLKSPAPTRPAPRSTAAPAQPVPTAAPPAAPVTERIPPKAEPGKPIYARKPTRTRPLIEKRFAEGERKLHPVRARPGVVERRGARAVAPPAPVVREPREITITEGITVRELAEKLDVRAKDLLKTLLDKGIFASINQALDIETATSLAQAFNGIVKVVSFEEEVAQEVVREEKPESLQPRAPVVTVMGHVDHGKTSLLDAIRQTNVAEGEAGGITQHIGASQVEVNGRKVVFIDTPGHEAFTRMRARGARVTDVVVLVVAADDGVKPQTLEAIDHARAAGVPILVAINKVDKPDAQPERVKRQLADLGLVPEEWGGDTVVVEVSAKLKKNLDRLLEMILLVGDLRELKANPNAPATGTVLESRIDRGRGPVATVLVQNGTLRVGDAFLCGAVYGKVRAMLDDRGHSLKEAGPSTPVEVLGLQGLPEAGDQFQVAEETRARQIVEYRQAKRREASLARTAGPRITLDQLHEQLKAGEVKELPLVVKADVQGSVEVLSEMLPRLSTDQVKIKIVHAGVGAVAETDVLLASASNAIIIAFNVRPDRKAAELAQRENVDIRTHSVIYEVADEIKKAMAGLLEPVLRETYLGRAEVRETFRIKGVGTVAGCYVQDGVVRRDAEVRLLRDGAVVYTGRPGSLKRFKNDVNEVRAGFECGIAIANFNDVKIGDLLEFFRVERLAAPEVTA
ncbi:MAG: translation initiation factor IF-2 [Firmicutes bacterium]|nr:translation initiation factor IF-2 [Bacillota bacterium]